MVNSYKPVRVDQVRGDLTVGGNSSQITVRRIDGNAELRTSYKPVSVAEVGGNLSIEAGSSRVTVQSVKGDLVITNSYKPVTIQGTAGSISVRGNNSAVEVTRIAQLSPGQTIDLTTTGKPITLGLPATAGFRGTLKTRFGQIRSDFRIIVDGDDKRKARLELGDGGGRIRIETDQDITLIRERSRAATEPRRRAHPTTRMGIILRLGSTPKSRVRDASSCSNRMTPLPNSAEASGAS